MAAESRVTVTLQDKDTFKVFNVQGTAPTIADARAEVGAKLNLIANVDILKVTESIDVTATAGYVPHTDGPDGDVSLTLRKGTDRSTTRTINIPNVSTDYADGTAQDGSVAVNDADIAAFGTAYRDADGVGGYTVIKGQFSN